MVFTSLTFLIFYASLLVAVNLIRDHRAKLCLLLAASYLFYAAWNPLFVLLIAFVSSAGWVLGRLIDQTASIAGRRAALAIGLILSLAPLVYYKYANFLVENLGLLLGVETPYFEVVLPVGISFFTFQVMSYIIDVYRGRISVCLSPLKFMLYVAFFPQLVAGPIVRASEFIPQLDRYIRIRWGNLWVGGQIFLGGAIQKVLVADQLAVFVDPVFAEPQLYSASTLWLALGSYSIQIFCDFSGYSLMAIGVARTLGFQLPKNFDMPYLALSITDFWRRWHITLSSWLRDYLYISLGGNRKGEVRTYVNLIVTMLLGGLWHGASWNFVLWGGMHGIGLAVHKVWNQRILTSGTRAVSAIPYKLASWIVTLGFVTLLWVPFRSPELATTVTYYRRLFQFDVGVDWMHTGSAVTLACVLLWHALHLSKARVVTTFPTRVHHDTWALFAIGASLMLIMILAPLDTSPFVYFQF